MFCSQTDHLLIANFTFGATRLWQATVYHLCKYFAACEIIIF